MYLKPPVIRYEKEVPVPVARVIRYDEGDVSVPVLQVLYPESSAMMRRTIRYL